jgi:hypothetical protein
MDPHDWLISAVRKYGVAFSRASMRFTQEHRAGQFDRNGECNIDKALDQCTFYVLS